MRHSFVAAAKVPLLVLAFLSPAAAAPRAREPSKAVDHGEKNAAGSKAATPLERAEAALLVDGDLDKATRIGAGSVASILLLQADDALIDGDLVAAKSYIDRAAAAGAGVSAFLLRAAIYDALADELHEQANASVREALKMRPGDPVIERLLSLPSGAPCR